MTSFNEWIANSGLNDDLDTRITLLTAELVSTIIARRKKLGLTQEELGNRANLSQSQIARLENSSQIPRLDTVVRVALSLNLTLTLTPEEPWLHTDEQAAGIESDLSLLKKHFTPEVVHALAELAEAMKESTALHDRNNQSTKVQTKLHA